MRNSNNKTISKLYELFDKKYSSFWRNHNITKQALLLLNKQILARYFYHFLWWCLSSGLYDYCGITYTLVYVNFSVLSDYSYNIEVCLLSWRLKRCPLSFLNCIEGFVFYFAFNMISVSIFITIFWSSKFRMV